MKSLLLVLFLLWPAYSMSLDTRCPVCGMESSDNSKLRFQLKIKDKESTVCSFSCADRLASKNKSVQITVYDYFKNLPLSAESAYFIVKSENISKIISNEMPPIVVSFINEEEAKNFKKKLGDGEVVKGLNALKKAYP